jgi:hypothetical protein
MTGEHAMIEDANSEERTAWDMAFAAVIAGCDVLRPPLAAGLAAKMADAMLEERRKRFGKDAA